MVADAQSDDKNFKLEGEIALEAMKREPRWVMWRREKGKNGKPTKAPYPARVTNRHASNKDPRDWAAYDHARDSARVAKMDGVGFMLTEHDQLRAMDLDLCRDPNTGALAPWANELVEAAGSYCEVTPSKTGIRIIGVGRPREPKNFDIKVPDVAKVSASTGELKQPHCELYLGGPRFITVSNDHIVETPETLRNIDAAIDEVLSWRGQKSQSGVGAGSEANTDQGPIKEYWLPPDLLKLVRGGVGEDEDRSAAFHHAVCWLADYGHPAHRIAEFLANYPDGIAAKYLEGRDRLAEEVARCYGKRQTRQGADRGAGADGHSGARGGDGGASQTESKSHAANDGEWPEPVDFLKGQTAPQFPLECLPDWFAEIISAYSQSLGTALPGVAMAFLAACAGAIPNQCRVWVFPGSDQWVRKPRLFVSLIGNSAAGKSPVMKAALAPLEGIDSVRRQIYQEEMATWNACEREKKGSGGPEPILRLGIVKDTTVEKLQIRQSQNPSGVIVHKDEMASWFGSMEKYSGGKAAHYDRAYYLSCYDGGPQTSDRVTRGYISIDDCGIDFLGGVVGESLRDLTGQVQNDGLFQRFIPVHLPNRVRGTGPVPQEQVDLYSGLISDLNSMPAATIEFDPMADAARKRYSDQWFELQDKLAGHWEPMAAAVAKYDNLLVQLAALLMLIENHNRLGVARTISSKHVHSAGRIIDRFVKPNHVRFFSSTVATEDRSAAVEAALWILANRVQAVRPSDLTAGIWLFRGKANRELINAAMDSLAMLGWVQPYGDEWRPKGWAVNPRVHELFADLGTREKERRTYVREKIYQDATKRN